MTMEIINISVEEHTKLVEKAKHLDRAYKIWIGAHFSGGPDRALNLTRFYDLLGMEAGASEWPDDIFLGKELSD